MTPHIESACLLGEGSQIGRSSGVARVRGSKRVLQGFHIYICIFKVLESRSVLLGFRVQAFVCGGPGFN